MTEKAAGAAGSAAPTPPAGAVASTGPGRHSQRWIIGLVVMIILAVLPWIDVSTGGVLPGRLNSPGSLQLLGLCLVFGALAMTYDLMFGFTGLLSFGHALFFGAGAYAFDMAVSVMHVPGLTALGVTVGVAVLLPLAIGAISLRTGGIVFAMVTLAFAQAGSVIVGQDPGGVTGGDLGLGLSYAQLPHFLVGVVNTRYLYWLSLALLVVVASVVWWTSESVTGRVWQAIRENERRVKMLGLRPYTFKLLAFVTASFLAALCGVVYLFLIGGADPSITTAEFTLSILVMVVLGGAGTTWGALIGGVVYTYLDHRLVAMAGAPLFASLPAPLRIPLSQPLFILGVIFTLIILFRPGGIASLFGAGAPPTAVARWRTWLNRLRRVRPG